MFYSTLSILFWITYVTSISINTVPKSVDLILMDLTDHIHSNLNRSFDYIQTNKGRKQMDRLNLKISNLFYTSSQVIFKRFTDDLDLSGNEIENELKNRSVEATLELKTKLSEIIQKEYTDAKIYSRKSILRKRNPSEINPESLMIAFNSLKKALETHPEAISEALKIEKRIWDLIKYGEDGTIKSSELALDIQFLNNLGIGPIDMIPIAFAAGVITVLVVQKIIFQWRYFVHY